MKRTLGAEHEIIRKNNICLGDMFPHNFVIAKVTMIKSMWASFEAPQAAALEENL